ncbi:hypothetical protein BGZ73_000019 [Actinomortierella ambigua]|nr:hypothetical protein BGZ73_000019 [Actinomortierella ambigua]
MSAFLLSLRSGVLTRFDNHVWRAEAAGCQHYKGGSNCPPEAPCCKSGWCSNAQSFCAVALGCQSDGSNTPDTCLPLPMCTNLMENLVQSLVSLTNFSGNPLDATWTTDFVPNHARIEGGQLILSMMRGSTVNKFGRRPGFGATVSSTRWMLYGTVSARIKTGSSKNGVVTSFIFRNDKTGDEIDYEWVGRAPMEVQSNYYWQTPASMDPKLVDYSNQRKTVLAGDLSQEYHLYTIEWLPDRMSWYTDGNLIRTILRSEVKGDKYPSTPCQIQFSIWDGGSDSPETAEWAGGPTPWGPDNGPTVSGTTDPLDLANGAGSASLASAPVVYEAMIDYVDIKCHSPAADAGWPPPDHGFQHSVNPFAAGATGDALVLGDGAPAVSTLDRGGFHWPKPGERPKYAQSQPSKVKAPDSTATGRNLNQRRPSSSSSLVSSIWGVGAVGGFVSVVLAGVFGALEILTNSLH